MGKNYLTGWLANRASIVRIVSHVNFLYLFIFIASAV